MGEVQTAPVHTHPPMFCDLLKICVMMGHVLSACALLSSLTALVFVISQGVISNTQRIDAAIPTISYALEQGAKVCFVNDTNLPVTNTHATAPAPRAWCSCRTLAAPTAAAAQTSPCDL